MLRNLQIENYALIHSLDISFDKGFTAITGETGAGKSILLGALSLLMGNRADTDVLNDKSRKCYVEGTFDIGTLSLQSFFEENDLEKAYRVEPLEELIDNLCDEMKLHHIDRLKKGKCTLSNGFVFNDLLTNLERVSDHCSNVAIAMIEIESDSFDPHEYISSLTAVHTQSFDEYFAEYSSKYHF